MPRVATNKPQKQVLHQTIEMSPAPSNEPEQQKPEKPDFWSYMQSLTPDDWKDHIVYITRERPKTSINGLGGYLVKLQQPFDIEDIKTAYGGYEFSYIMKKKNDIAYGGKFSIEAPPRYDPSREQASVATAPAQSESATSLATQVATILREQLDHERERNDRPNPATDRALDLVTEASKQSMQIVKDQVPKPSSATGELRELVAAMKDMGIIGGNGGSTLGNLVRELQPLIGLLGPLIEKFLKPQDPITQLAGLKAVLDIADDLRGKGGSGKGATTQDLILKGLEILPDAIGQLSAQRAGVVPQRDIPLSSPAGSTPAPPRMAPTQSAPQAAVDRPATAAAPGNGFNVVPLDRGDVGAPTADAQPIQPSKEEFDRWVSTRVVEMIYLGFDGGGIVDFLDTVKPEVVRDLAKFTEEQINYAFSLDPILTRATQHPNWSVILREARQAAAEIVAEQMEEETLEPAKVN